MSTAVRYYSRSGNTRAVAEAIAAKAGLQAVSVDSPEAGLSDGVDVLFIGGALYAYGIDKHLKKYLKTLGSGDAKKAVVFSTARFSKHALDVIKKELAGAGIPVEEETFFSKGKPGGDVLKAAADFAGRFIC